jgi:hypothetical protein
MKQIVLLITLFVSVCLASCASQPASLPAIVTTDAGLQEEPVFLVTTQNSEDRVTIQHEDDKAMIDIASPSGIGAASFELESGSMPGRIVARLHLGGLEEFRLTYGQTVIVVSVPSGSVLYGHAQTLVQSGRETSIEAGHPLWMEVRIVSNEESPKIPLENGYFEVEFPSGFGGESEGTFEIRWIDFYR